MVEKHYEFKIDDEAKAFTKWLKQNGDVEHLVLSGEMHFADIVIYDDDMWKLPLKSVDIADLQVGMLDMDEFQFMYVDNGEQVPPLLKMILNKDYSAQFVVENGEIYSADHKMLVHTKERKQIAVKNGVEHIGKTAFFAYTFNTISLPTTLRSIGDYAFCWCENENEIRLPQSVIRLGEWAFAYSDFSTVTLPDTIEELPEYCFHCMNFMEKFEFPKSLKYIRCGNGLGIASEKWEVVLPEGVEVVEYFAFNYIKSIYIPSSVKHLDSDWFWDCSYFGEEAPRQPKIYVSPDNRYFGIEKGKLVRNYVADEESQREFSRKVLDCIDSEALREHLRKLDLLFTPVEMIVIAINTRGKHGRDARQFLYELANTTFLTETDRLYLDFEMKRLQYIWDQFNNNWYGQRYLVAFGRNSYNEKWKRIGKFTTPCATLDFEKRKLHDKYKYIHVYQYDVNDPDKNEIGSYTLSEDYRQENFWVANIDLKVPQKLKSAIRKEQNLPKNQPIDISNTLSMRYILLPIPFKRGDVVRLLDSDLLYVVIDAEMVSDHRMKWCDDTDMSITVAPAEYTDLVRSCGDGELPEEVWLAHNHISIFELDMA